MDSGNKKDHLRGEQVAKGLLKAVFQQQGGNAQDPGVVWLASVTGQLVSGQASGWHGGPARQIIKTMTDDSNNYYCVGTLKPGSTSRGHGSVSAVRALVLDDVGSAKVTQTAEAVTALFGGEPAFIVQTSASSQQWVYIPDEPIIDLELFDQVMDTLAANGYTDNGAKGRERFVRLPWGKNTKPSHGGLNGPNVYLARDPAPDNRFSFDALVFALEQMHGLDSAPSSAGVVPAARACADLGNPDAMLRALIALGRAKSELKEGVIDITCPFIEEHTDQADSGTAYLGDGAIVCHHGHCQSRTPEQWRKRVEELAAASGIASAGLAFDGSDVDAEAVSSLAAEVNSIAKAMAEAPADDWVDQLNERYAIVQGIKGVIYFPPEEDKDPDVPLFFTPMGTDDFKNYWNSRTVEVVDPISSKRVKRPMGDAWLRHPKRRTHTGVGLWPAGSEPDGALNIYAGFNVQPDATKAWKTVEAFLRDVICSGVDAHYQWVMAWLAQKAQNPLERAETALVLIGEQGTGKGTLLEFVSDIFGPRHCLHATMKDHLLGKFNDGLEHALFVLADEALFGKDPSIRGQFKALITERNITVEAKFQSRRTVKNRMAVLVTSNEEAAAPIDPKDRRSTVLEVSSARIQDRVYFGKLKAAWSAGEREGFLAALLSWDLSKGPDPKVPLATAAKAQMALATSNDPVSEWWAEVLDSGSFPDQMATGWDAWDAQTVDAQTARVFEAFERWLAMRRRNAPVVSPVVFGRRLSAMVNRQENRQKIGGKTVVTHTYEKLDDARVTFEKYVGGA